MVPATASGMWPCPNAAPSGAAGQIRLRLRFFQKDSDSSRRLCRVWIKGVTGERKVRSHTSVFGWCVTLLLIISLSGCSRAADKDPTGAVQRGRGVYALWCAPCHDAEDLHLVKTPPRLEGLFFRQSLPSGAPATDEQVRATVLDGLGIMPPFRETLKEDEIEDLMEFLHSLKAASN